MGTVINFEKRDVVKVDDVDVQYKRAVLRLKEAEAARLEWELRQAKRRAAWRAVRRTLLLGALAWLTFSLASARAGDMYYGANGQLVGSSSRVGRTTIYFDHQGRFAGTRVRSGIVNDPARRGRR